MFIPTQDIVTLSLQTNTPFNKEVTHAQFFYMDKFILLTSANVLHLYKYSMGLDKVDDIKRFFLVIP